MKFRSLVLIGALAVLSQMVSAAGAYIVTGGTITSITNTASNTSAFTVTTSGGTGVCTGVAITFPLSSFPDADTMARAYATALTALALNATVTIYNYSSSTCTTATYIQIN
jgi:hypothetical protein